MRRKVLKILTIIVLTLIIGYAAWQFLFMYIYGVLTGWLP